MAGLHFKRLHTSRPLIAGIGFILLIGWVSLDERGLMQSNRLRGESKSTAALSGMALIKGQVQSNPRDWRWSLLLARAQLRQGDREAAAITLKRLETLHPNRLQVMALRGLLSVESGRSLAAVDQMTQQFKKSTTQRLPLGLLLADLHRLNGDLSAARSLFEQLIKDNPKRIEPLLALALLKRDQGQGDQAIALLNQSVRLGGDGPLNQNNLASIRMRWSLEAARKNPWISKPVIRDELQRPAQTAQEL